MARFSRSKITSLLDRCDNATTKTEKGRALENLICYLLEKVPGISIAKRNSMNYFRSEEIDVAFWNEGSRTGFHFLPNIVLVECKNWNTPVGSQEVDWFISKIRRHGQNFGILIAMNGITGISEELNRAHNIVSAALAQRIQIIVIFRHEIQKLLSTEYLVKLIKEKLCELTVRGTICS